jgi:hypothetical protein
LISYRYLLPKGISPHFIVLASAIANFCLVLSDEFPDEFPDMGYSVWRTAPLIRKQSTFALFIIPKSFMSISLRMGISNVNGTEFQDTPAKHPVWKRWVRFRAEDGKIYGGEPVNPDIDGMANSSSRESIPY